MAREGEDASRARDAFEKDSDLQQRTAAVYEALARDQWQSPWVAVEPGEVTRQATEVVEAILRHA